MEANLEHFPEELAARIRKGRDAGLSDDQIAEGIVQLGDVMVKFVHPDSPEEALMRTMWEVSTDQEKQMFGNIIVRMSKKQLH